MNFAIPPAPGSDVPSDPVAAAYVDLTVAIVTLQEQVRRIERLHTTTALRLLETAQHMNALLSLNGKQIDLLRKIAELLEEDA